MARDDTDYTDASVLVADDDPVFLKMVQKDLDRAGFHLDLDQDIDTRFTLAGTAFSAGEQHRVEYRGIGPRVSAALSIPVSDWGLRLGGAVGGALILGNIDRVTRQAGTPPFIPVSASGSKQTRTAHVLDAEVHVSYQRPLDASASVDLSVGYRGEAWLGVNDTTSRASPTGSRFGTTDADQRFHGPFVRLTYSF